ncbi:hypothetical protein B6K05_009025 [Mycobacterium avium subsp. hominissuis]|nr:hypothetical protein B6K05_009025 [Mycobacterium avium subsp. hominissuis]
MARTRAQGAGLAVGTAGIMLGAAVFGGAVLSAPPAAAGSRPVEWCKSGRVSACGSVVATMP